MNNKQRKRIIAENEITVLKTYQLGSYNQKILFDGKSKENPVLLVLHGGPGMPIPFSAGCRGMFPEFTEKFIMVYWDQLGCGINNYLIDDEFSIENFTTMTVDLVKAIKSDFPNNQLVLLGTSWGSVLSAKTASRVPNLIDNVIVYGQILKDLFFNEEVYTKLEQSELSEKEKKSLSRMKDAKKHTTDDLKKIAKLIRKYTEGYQAKTDEKSPMGKMIFGMLRSPDYKLKDFFAVVKNGFMKNTSIWNELMQIDLSTEIQNTQVPYRIVQGSTDIVTSTQNILKFIEQSQNPNLSISLIENNGHMPNSRGIDKVFKECVGLIK